MSGCYAVFHKQLGDLVLLEPALTRLREHHGEPVRLLTRNGHAAVVKLMPGVRLARGMPMVPSRYLYCFDPLSKSSFRSFMTPTRFKKILLPERREQRWYHTRIFSQVETPELGNTYVAEFFWSHLPVPTQKAFRPPRLKPPPAEWAPPGRAPRSYVLINPTAGWRHKAWTAKGWATVLLAQEQVGPFLMTSGGTDWQISHCREIAERTGSCIENLASVTTLREYLWLCANARAVLTVDGAASHLASAFGVPCLTLFGPTNIHNWHHSGQTHIAVQAPMDKDGIRRLRLLNPESVIDVLRSRQILEGSRW